MYMHVDAEVDIGCLPPVIFTLGFETGSLIQPGSHLLAIKFWGSALAACFSHIHLSSVGITDVHYHAWHFCVFFCNFLIYNLVGGKGVCCSMVDCMPSICKVLSWILSTLKKNRPRRKRKKKLF